MAEISYKSYPNVIQSFGIAGITILGMLLASPVMFALVHVIGREAATLLYYITAMGGSFAVIYLIRKKKTGISTFPRHINSRLIPVLALITLALLFGVISPLASLVPLSDSMKKVLLELGNQTGPLAFITMVIAAPVLEELIFRGIILDGLLTKYSPLKSILLSSLIFGLVHLNLPQFITGLIIGIFAGWVYFNTRSILACIVIHAVANLAGFCMRFFVDIESLVKQDILKMYGGLSNFIFITAGSMLIVTIAALYLRKEFKAYGLHTFKNHLNA